MDTQELDSLSKSDLKDLLVECYRSTKVFAKVMFPERFHRPFSSVYDQIFDALDDASIQKLAIIAPRGIGKTSIIHLAYQAKMILFKEASYIVPISLSSESAIEQTENLKRELESNVIINRLFGNLKGGNWAKESWETSNGVFVRPRGAGQQVRGLLHKNSRPNRIVIDDIQDKEIVRSEMRIHDLKTWLNSDVCNSVDRGSNDWRIIALGSLLGGNDVMSSYLEDKSWTTIQLSICDESFESNFPDYMTTDVVRRLAQEHRDRGMFDEFCLEYMSLPVSEENAAFTTKHFRYYEESDLVERVRQRKVETAVLIDPAKTAEAHSCETAIVAVGIDREANKIYIRDIEHGKMHFNEVIDKAFEICNRYAAKVLGVEVTGLNEFITYPLKNEMTRRKQYFELIELKARGKKEDRIAGLIPLYRRGMVYHNQQVTVPLEAQLLSFPRSKRFDIMDALAYITELLELGDRYFLPEGFNESEDEDLDKAIEDLYANERMPKLKTKWRY